jgi:sigma-B regulation protein RsbU (phosphoserine phosphatase)
MSGASKRGLSVGTKLTAATVVLLAAALGGSAFYSYRTLQAQAASAAEAQRRAGEAAMRRQSQLLVRNIASASGVLLAGGDFQSLKEQVASTLSENPNIAWLVVSYEQGGTSQVVAASELAPYPEGKPLDDALAGELRAQPRSSRIIERAGDDPYLAIVGANVLVDLPDGERAVGQVRLAQSRRELEEALSAQLAEARGEARASARRQLIAAGVILLLGILLGTYQGLRITRPLQALNAQAGAIAAGDFDRRVEVPGNDEIGQLAASFNSMAESLGTVLDEMAAKASLERELELARSVQELMSPPPSLHRPGRFRIAGKCELAESCGGDWWSYRLLSDDRLLLVVGDVTGHGMPAAMIAATARGAVEALNRRDEDQLTPLEVLEAIDRAVRDVGKQELLMTCFALIIDPGAGLVRFANAGHCFPYVLRPDDDGRLAKPGVLAVRGNPLGNETKVLREGERELAPGDVLVLTTDGLTDRISGGGERFGERRLRELMVSYPMGSDGDKVLALRDAIVSEVDGFAAGQPADDDLTLVVCQLLERSSASKVEQGAA